jgi:hypothetical protein
VLLVYYLILGTASRLADSGALSPTAAAWVPNGLITFIAVLIVVKMGQEIHFGIGSRISGLARLLLRPLRKKGRAP